MTNVRRRAALGVVALTSLVAIWLLRQRAGDRASSEPQAAGEPAPSSRSSDDSTRGWFGLAARGRRVAGVVLGDDEAPVAGATVHLDGPREVEVVTDAAGRFDFGPCPASSYVIEAQTPKLTGARDEIDLRDPAADVEHVTLLLHACDASIHGTVGDVAGGVIAGARVVQTRYWRPTRIGATTDARGEYELCLPAGQEVVVVAAEGYASETEPISTYGHVRRDFALSPGASIAGRVIRASDRSPVGGASVELQADGEVPDVRVSAQTDASGQFRIDGVAPGQHHVSAWAPGLVMPDAMRVIAEVGRPQEITCELTQTQRVTGVIVERGSHTPVPGISIGLVATGGTRSSTGTTSQADGSFELDHVVPGDYEVYADRKEPVADHVEGLRSRPTHRPRAPGSWREI